MSDSEVLTLMLLAQWYPAHLERPFLRYVRSHWQAYFPRVLDQSAFNRRVRDLLGVLCQLGTVEVCARDHELTGSPAYEVLDGVPVPLMRRCRGVRHRLFANEAAIGCGGSDRDWYYGVELLGIVTQAGLISGFVLAPATTEERWQAEALLGWRHDPAAPEPTADRLDPVLGKAHRRQGKRQGPTGPIGPRQAAGRQQGEGYLADGGFRGATWQQHWQADYGAWVLTPADLSEPASPPEPAQESEGEPPPPRRKRYRISGKRWLAHLRQVVERTFGLLDAVFGLKFPRARTRWGLYTRVAAKVAAFNLAIHINHLYGRPSFDLFHPFLD